MIFNEPPAGVTDFEVVRSQSKSGCNYARAKLIIWRKSACQKHMNRQA